ncbi:helix-turn-helix domain-containing protein [Streptacidiphilus sp. N1-3]|uniref:Helix-turn-helix domain-containing protein n=1 Tax=Streptacidiphilus alkalitolerans TaxID=3342712 RepID=A0ABV6XER0_9ACTN
MPAREQPTARQVRLGALLRGLRGDRGQSVVKTLAWSEAKISRIESGRSSISADDLSRLLDLYEIESDDLRAYLEDLRRRGGVQGWESDPALRGILSPEYAEFIGFENDASEMYNVQATVVPGLLQTVNYTKAALLLQVQEDLTEEEVEKLSEVRAKRQQAWQRPVPLTFWGIISESVLRHNVGGEAVMKEQLEYLLELSRRFEKTINLHILPEESGAHAALYPFAILSFPERWEPDVVYIEGLTGTRYLEKQNETAAYGKLFRRLLAETLRKRESRQVIRQYAEKWS